MVSSRYRRILFFFGQVILSFIGWEIILPRIGLRGFSRKTRANRYRRIAARFRVLAVAMGGVMIKVGQFLSARLDVLPPEITDELSGLQDEVQPESFTAIRQVLELEMNGPIEVHFLSIDPHPLASASIGQVHRGQIIPLSPVTSLDDLPPPVVVKVQRPDIPALVQVDLAALRVVSRWLNAYPPIHRRASVPALLEEFSRVLFEEMDYLNEGKNAETFAANFRNRPQIRVPKVIWSHTTRRVLTLEEIDAIKIIDYERITAAGIDRAEVAERLIDTYLKQIFEDRFFHADPHPGNLFVLPAPEPGEDWQLVFVDFGMTGSISPGQLDALREILIAVGTQDVPRLIRAYRTMGILLPGADVALLEKATQNVFENIWGKSTAEMISLSHEQAVTFAREFGDLLYELPFQVPQNLILLGRCLGILSGICSGLNPDFNVWVSVTPYVRRLVEAEKDGGHGVIVEEGLKLFRSLLSLPGRAENLLQRIEQGRLEIQSTELRNQIARLDRRVQRLAGAVVFAALLTAAVQLYLGGSVGLAIAGSVCASFALLWTAFGR